MATVRNPHHFNSVNNGGNLAAGDETGAALGFSSSLAQSHYLTGLLIEEILATNDIEGIRSTRQEITEALASGNSDRTKRFQEMAQLYKRLATRSGSRIEFPKSLSEVRSLYDDLLRDEISPEDKPDGTHFRAQTVSVVDGLKTIHTAPRDEASINTRMEAFLDSQLGKEHALVNALMGHFMFEYTHPFMMAMVVWGDSF